MKLHEYQAKDLLRQRGVNTLKSRVCFTLKEAESAINEIKLPLVIKAQVHAGGRGKAGGVKVAHDRAEALKIAEKIIGMTIKNNQTGEEGQKVSAILIEQAAKIKSESYLSMLIDRESQKICLIAAKEGGMEIEELAHSHPEKIKKIIIDQSIGLMPYQLRELVLDLDFEPTIMQKFVSLVMSVYKTFIDCDASLIEINPLAILEDNSLIALDAKIVIDDNAMFRQKTISEMRDTTQENPKEVAASNHNLSYVSLDGNIGCMVNGAGLAMATMDTIKHVGGNPANFLDVGGSATKERVEEALKIMTSEQKVKAIFINVFGGIVKCDLIAQGVVNAAKSLSLSLPLVVRLEGTNVEKGREILAKSELKIFPASNMLDGAKKAVELAG